MAGPVITRDMIIGEVMEKYPGTAEVFRKYFGKGCFDCPGSGYEDIDFGSGMHNADIDALLRELNEAAEGKGKGKGDGHDK
ncbi:DUF1858 domain-containing protein [bacterium]|nr:DUF1858 domain-containing protein [bacterium]